MNTDKSMPAYKLTKDELINSRLADLAKASGHASLNSFLNDQNLWGSPIFEIESMLLPASPKESGNTATIELMADAKSNCTFRYRGYIVQLQEIDIDDSVHGGLNIVNGSGLLSTSIEMLEGCPMFILQNVSGYPRPLESGWLCVARSLEDAISYIKLVTLYSD